MKRNKEDSDEEALILKKKTLGQITVDDPDTGYVKVSLLADDTDIAPGLYFAGLQLDYGNGKVYEVDIYVDSQQIETFKVKQDIVRG